MVRGEDRPQASGNKGESGPVIVTPVRDVAGRFQGPGGCWGARAAGVLVLNYADLAWGKGRPLET